MTGKSKFGSGGQNGHFPREMAFAAMEFVFWVSIFRCNGQWSFSDPRPQSRALITVDLY
jgi:hypothetical protein